MCRLSQLLSIDMPKASSCYGYELKHGSVIKGRGCFCPFWTWETGTGVKSFLRRSKGDETCRLRDRSWRLLPHWGRGVSSRQTETRPAHQTLLVGERRTWFHQTLLVGERRTWFHLIAKENLSSSCLGGFLPSVVPRPHQPKMLFFSETVKFILEYNFLIL